MPVVVLDFKTLYDEIGIPNRQGALFEIEDGGPTYLWRHGNIPLGLDEAQIEAWLEDPARFAELYAAAERRGEPAPTNILDNPNIDELRALAASLLVILDQINVLRVRAGLPEISRQQAYSAIRDKYIELGQE